MVYATNRCKSNDIKCMNHYRRRSMRKCLGIQVDGWNEWSQWTELGCPPSRFWTGNSFGHHKLSVALHVVLVSELDPAIVLLRTLVMKHKSRLSEFLWFVESTKIARNKFALGMMVRIKLKFCLVWWIFARVVKLWCMKWRTMQDN